ncbi:MAG: tetratricopeptide repeat protein [Nitrospirota bacterium]
MSMRITTSCHWLLACLLTQGLPLDVAAAADTRPLPPATLPIHALPVHASFPASSSRLTLPDKGPRYDHIVEGSGSLQFQETVAAFKHGQYAVARAGFSALLKQDPDSRLVPSMKAFLAELTLLEDPTGHGRAEAITQYRALIRLHPKDPNTARAFWRIGDLYVEMGWFQEAIVAYEYAASHVFARADADRSILSLGVTLESRERWAEAEQAFETVRKRTTDDRVLMRATLGLANALCALQRKREAQPLYDMLYQRWPDLLRSDPQVLHQYGDVLVDTNEPQRARAIDTLLYNLYPSYPYAGAALVRLGDSHRRLGLQKQAEMFYLAAQTQYAGTPEAGIARMHLARIEQEIAVSAGESFLKKKVEGMVRGASASYLESSEGETLYATIAKEHPHDFLGSEALFQLAAHYELRGAPSRAIQTYLDVTRRAGMVDHDPWPQAARLRLAVMLKPQLEAALKAKNDVQVVTLFHSHGPAPEQHYSGTRLLLEVAETHRRLGFSAEAVRLYQTLVRDRKAARLHESALIGLGESYLDQRESAAARNVFESFRLQYPQSSQSKLVLRQLTTAMREQGDRSSAIRLMRQWLRAHPREAERGWMQLTLAKTLADDHQTGAAVAAFEEAARHKFMQSQSDRLMFADLLTTLNKHRQAVDLYQRILVSNPAPDQAEWARLQIVRNLATQKLHGPVHAVLTPGAGTGDPLLYRAAEAIQASLRVTTEKEGG